MFHFEFPLGKRTYRFNFGKLATKQCTVKANNPHTHCSYNAMFHHTMKNCSEKMSCVKNRRAIIYLRDFDAS